MMKIEGWRIKLSKMLMSFSDRIKGNTVAYYFDGYFERSKRRWEHEFRYYWSVSHGGEWISAVMPLLELILTDRKDVQYYNLNPDRVRKFVNTCVFCDGFIAEAIESWYRLPFKYEHVNREGMMEFVAAFQASFSEDFNYAPMMRGEKECRISMRPKYDHEHEDRRLRVVRWFVGYTNEHNLASYLDDKWVEKFCRHMKYRETASVQGCRSDDCLEYSSAVFDHVKIDYLMRHGG